MWWRMTDQFRYTVRDPFIGKDCHRRKVQRSHSILILGEGIAMRTKADKSTMSPIDIEM